MSQSIFVRGSKDTMNDSIQSLYLRVDSKDMLVETIQFLYIRAWQ
jgi:hypothetical protein